MSLGLFLNYGQLPGKKRPAEAGQYREALINKQSLHRVEPAAETVVPRFFSPLISNRIT
jgi:hypothetical protein